MTVFTPQSLIFDVFFIILFFSPLYFHVLDPVHPSCYKNVLCIDTAKVEACFGENIILGTFLYQ